jgi:hypothetical protein
VSYVLGLHGILFKNGQKWCLLVSELSHSRVEKILKDNNNLVLGKKPKTSLYVDQTYWVYKDLPAIPDIFMTKIYLNRCERFHRPLGILIYLTMNKINYLSIRELYETTDYSIMLAVGFCLKQAKVCIA